MGLDMYLTKKIYGLSYEHNRNGEETKIVINGKEYPSKDLDEISYNVGYWRKANAIHKWFVDNVQGGEDDCKEYWVPIEKLQELYDICKSVSENPYSAEELLPTESGFFFGDTAYDEYYIQGVRETMEMIEPLLISDEPRVNYYYRSSW